jgi:hypothetical protein
MSSATPKGWEKDSDKLFIHNSGVRIQLMTYRQKEGWYLVPTDLDQPVVEFEPTPEGRQKAFDAFAAGVLDAKPKRKKAEASETASKKKKKAAAAKSAGEEEEEEEGKGSKEKDAEKEGEEDDDEEDEDEGDDDEG